MERKEFDKKQLLVLVSSPLLALFSFVITYYLDPLNYGENVSLASIPSFLLSIIILVS